MAYLTLVSANNAAKFKGKLNIKLTREGKTVLKETKEVVLKKESFKTILHGATLKKVDAWSAEIPNLYQLEIELTDKKGKTMQMMKFNHEHFKKFEKYFFHMPCHFYIAYINNLFSLIVI